MSLFSMGGAKRLSYATTIGGGGDMMHEPEQAQLHHAHTHARVGSGSTDMHEVSQLMFQSHLIAPSDAGSSRRGSSGSSAPDPYLHRPGLYDDDASPYDNTRGNRYSAEEHQDHVISPETRDLSPLEAEAEADRISIVPEVPRKSSKRASRLMSPDAAARVAAATAGAGSADEEDDVFEVPRKSSKRLSRGAPPTTTTTTSSAVHHEEEEEDDDYDDDDRLEVASVTLPLRKPSRRETTDDAMEDVALRSTYSTSLYSQ